MYRQPRYTPQPPIFWVASLASLGIIIGGVGPWATWLNSVQISGTSLHGWREVAVGAVALGVLIIRQWGGQLVPGVIAAVMGIVGLVGAIDAIHTVTRDGAITFFGVTYRYLGAAWGLYLVAAAAAVLIVSASLLVWGDVRAKRGRPARVWTVETPRIER
jgi:hypothetical protein